MVWFEYESVGGRIVWVFWLGLSFCGLFLFFRRKILWKLFCLFLIFLLSICKKKKFSLILKKMVVSVLFVWVGVLRWVMLLCWFWLMMVLIILVVWKLFVWFRRFMLIVVLKLLWCLMIVIVSVFLFVVLIRKVMFGWNMWVFILFWLKCFRKFLICCLVVCWCIFKMIMWFLKVMCFRKGCRFSSFRCKLELCF